MDERYKLYALGVSMIVVWSLPSILVGLLLAGLIYIHPYSPPVFAYLDMWLKTTVPKLPQRLEESGEWRDSATTVHPPKPSPQMDAYFCTHLTKAGTRCRMPPGPKGLCKRHKSVTLETP